MNLQKQHMLKNLKKSIKKKNEPDLRYFPVSHLVQTAAEEQLIQSAILQATHL